MTRPKRPPKAKGPPTEAPLTVRVTDLAATGSGIARDEQGRVIFVPMTAPGDLARVQVTRAEKRYAEAEVLELIERSPERIEPRCAVFGKCGGCTWQHIPYAKQWQTKAHGLEHMLGRRQITLPKALEEFPAENPWEYRNRIQLRGDGRQLGFYQRRSLDLVPIERCEISRPEINAALPRLREEGAKLPRAYKVEVEALDDGRTRESWNASHAAMGFRQVNDAQNAKMQEWLVEALPASRVLYDLYGGAGNFSRPLAAKTTEIHCVDVGSPSQRPADLPANLALHRSSVLPWLERRFPIEPTAELPAIAIVDPPREGMDQDCVEIENNLRRLGVTTLAAIGCDANSWSADVARFIQRGWRLTRVAAFDLFPQTPHIEGIAVLTRPLQ